MPAAAVAEHGTNEGHGYKDFKASHTKRVVHNGQYALEFDFDTGLLSSITNLKTNATTALSIEWGWYNSSVGGCTMDQKDQDIPFDTRCDGQKSGAYIFNPTRQSSFTLALAQMQDQRWKSWSEAS